MERQSKHVVHMLAGARPADWRNRERNARANRRSQIATSGVTSISPLPAPCVVEDVLVRRDGINRGGSLLPSHRAATHPG